MAEADFIYCADTIKSKSNAGRSRKIKINPPLCWLRSKDLSLSWPMLELFCSIRYSRMGGVFPASTEIRPFFLLCHPSLLFCALHSRIGFLELSTTTLRNYFNTKSNVQPVT
ncbi:hypothetical protein CEXT_597441 [Caerostris extrusa]|uniref:Uncharacterized protein n=1 Tax=Caerostris extrusa TaxID=172846 RepID=A0AAV4WEE8_CAEEX|nr:hypothetical protein CEXT_597441 [Caerostris extrusa]